MRILKPGEPCPCCGQLIPDCTTRAKLLLLSYIAEGISLLDAINTLTAVMELPLSGGLEQPEAEQNPQTGKQSEDKGDLGQKKIGLRGPKANEKREIMERLKAYRKKNGLGCWAAVVAASGGKLSDDQLRIMHAGTEVLPINDWRLADKALDKLEAAHA